MERKLPRTFFVTDYATTLAAVDALIFPGPAPEPAAILDESSNELRDEANIIILDES